MPEEPRSPREMRFSNIFARLSELPNYIWDSDIKPFHSVSYLEIIKVVRLTQCSPTTTGTFLAIRKPRLYRIDHTLDVEALFLHRPPHIRQTRTVHQSHVGTSRLVVMPVLRPFIVRYGQ